ncbi:MAG: acetate--CoA ligase family protein [Nanoarchaeota archaeon]
MQLSQKEAQTLLKKYKIDFPKTEIFKENYIKRTDLKFPLVLKIDSPDIIHKSDMGLVFTGLKSLHDINQNLRTSATILKMHKIEDYNFQLQETITGDEIIMGMKRDTSFGPVILFGLGGIFVEVIKDVSMRIAPLTKTMCIEMIDSIKGIKILEGYRNAKPANKEKLAELLMKLSDISIKEKQIQEIDFNPVIVNDKKAVVVDARIIAENV